MIEAAIICAALAIYHEAKFEPVQGQLAVAMVILNRAKRQPDKVCEVVFARKQFSFTIKMPPITDHEKFTELKGMARAAWYISDFTHGADHYHAEYVLPNWAHSKRYVGQWGSHIFYRKRT